ncbi:MAG: mannose-6-phosphate isomerase, class I [Spirochaetales bacterium]|nr:mannose-6-phosphate isomerase, class I [Spirochaetales bacterium]
MKSAYVLHNTIQEYAWGSRTAIPELLGLPSPSERPQAELWMGAHPKAPSRVSVEDGEIPLNELVQRDPAGLLGRRAARRFGGELPFLFKVIAAAAPLSIQVHPSAEQAREGFRRENEAGIPLDAFERNYRDPNHKPEVLSALTPFWAMCGFRPLGEILALFESAGPPSLAPETAELARRPTPEGLRGFFQALMTLPERRRLQAVAETLVRASGPEQPALEGSVPAPAVRRWIVSLAEHYPGDIGVLAPLLLNLVELQPGDTMFLEAGIPHAYLQGTGIELMANSDNVLRGGLTPKHVDVPELLRTLRFDGAPAKSVLPRVRPSGETLYRTPAREFLLSEIRPPRGRGYRSPKRRNVEILLCVSGAARLRTHGSKAPRALTLEPGSSILVPAAAPAYRLEGTARLFKATVP